MKPKSGFAAILIALAAADGMAEVAATKERVYVVKYSDQSIERYAVRWTLDVVSSVRELGGSYVPYQGATENRRCAWVVSTAVERSVALATRLGPTIPLAEMSRKLGEGDSIKGEHPGACAPTAPQAAALDQARRSALETFERATEADLEQLAKAARGGKDVGAVTIQ